MRVGSSIRAPLLALVITTGCFPAAGPPVGPAEIGGPTLAFVVTNRTNENRVIGYEFEAEGTSGGGEGEVPCGRTVVEFGGATGSYVVDVDGEEVASGEVPQGARVGSYLVFRIEIDEDGSPTAIGPVLSAQPPVDGPLSLEICE